MKQIFSSQTLRDFVQASGLSLRELSSEINYSTTTLSLWLRGEYPNAAKLEDAIAKWANALALTPADRRKFSYISDLLDNAEDKQAIIDTILHTTRSIPSTTQTKRSSSGMPALSLPARIGRRGNQAVAQGAPAHSPVPQLQKGIRK
jgi:transcriptional regulator with XRE-family HTH domain